MKIQTPQQLKAEMQAVARGEILPQPDACQDSCAPGFIQDECASGKEARRSEFAKAVERGDAKSSDASMFRGLKSGVKFMNEGF
ncbi:hypothetical protein [Sideroxydans sp.]